MSYISTKEAQSKKLPGSDSYRVAHISYLNDVCRYWNVVALCLEAYTAFSDTVLVSNRSELVEESQSITTWATAGGMISDLPMPHTPLMNRKLVCRNLEYLKIGCGFELYLKANLLSQGFIIHKLEKNPSGAYCQLEKKQQKNPILISELLGIDGFRFDGNENFLPGLTEDSLRFSTLINKEGYTKKLDISKQLQVIIKYYREMRNQTHLPGDMPAGVKNMVFDKGVNIDDLVVKFVNERIVNWTNDIISEHQFRFKPIERID